MLGTINYYINELLTLYGAVFVFLFVLVSTVVGPLVYKHWYSLQRALVFLNFVSWPRNPKFDKPQEYGLDGTLNFYLTTDDGVRLGIWHVLPQRVADNNETEYSREYFLNALNCSDDVIIYNHGNANHRVAAHRVEIYKLLRRNFHVFGWDYRGYGDSSNVEPTEAGLVKDAKFLYEWVVNQTEANVFIWGHSLGTGVSTHMLGDLAKTDIRKPAGLILESPFNNMAEEIPMHPIAQVYSNLPWFYSTIIEPMIRNGFVFASDKHIIKIDCPIMFLHAEDDAVVPYRLGRKLYEAANDYRRSYQGSLTFITFKKKYHYGHKDIYRAPNLEELIMNFVTNSTREMEEKRLICQTGSF